MAMTTTSTGEQRPGLTGRAAIELRGVHKHFGKVRAVRGVRFRKDTARV